MKKGLVRTKVRLERVSLTNVKRDRLKNTIT
jgi:hypothetical protein